MDTAAEAAPPRHRRGGRVLLIALGAILVVLIGAAAWIGVRGVLAKQEIDELTPLAQQMRDAVAAGDLQTVDDLAPAFAETAASAASLTGDPVWRAAEVIPVAGPNLAAVRVVAASLADMSADLPALTGLLTGLTTPEDGRLLPLTALRAAEPSLTALDDAVGDARAQLAALDEDALITPVAQGVGEVRAVVDQLSPAADTIARASTVLPSMLGADGPRTLLVMIQNTAELRTGGGITGSFAELRAEDGRLSLVRQAQSSDFAPLGAPIIPLPDDVTAIYGDGVGRFVQNISMPPDFDLSGQLATAWWEQATATRPDTVISIDPVVLQALLAATGPVDLPSGIQLTSDNLVDVLLVQAYATLSSDEQTTLYQSAVEALFAKLSAGVDAVALATALGEPVAEGRISVWSPAAGDALGAALAGPQARQDAAGPGGFAVYLNDATGGKLSPFLTVAMDAAVAGCTADGRAEVVVGVDLTSTAPLGADQWPISVTGGGLFGVGAGDIGTNVSVEGPAGSFSGEVVVKGEPYAAATAMSGDRASSAARVNLSPGEETNRLEFHFVVPMDAAPALAVVHTPLLTPPTMTVQPGRCS